MNADGTSLRNVTRTPRAGDDEFAWSPDGRMIVFQSWHGPDVYVVNVDGGGRRNLTRTPGMREFGLAWSPGSTK